MVYFNTVTRCFNQSDYDPDMIRQLLKASKSGDPIAKKLFEERAKGGTTDTMNKINEWYKKTFGKDGFTGKKEPEVKVRYGGGDKGAYDITKDTTKKDFRNWHKGIKNQNALIRGTYYGMPIGLGIGSISANYYTTVKYKKKLKKLHPDWSDAKINREVKKKLNVNNVIGSVVGAGVGFGVGYGTSKLYDNYKVDKFYKNIRDNHFK